MRSCRLPGSYLSLPSALLSCICLLALPTPPVAAAGNTAAALRTGALPPAQLGRNLQGELVDLQQRRGKVVILTFWASWCGPCMRELPALARLQRAAGKDVLQVIAVNWDEPLADVTDFAIRHRKLDLEYVVDAKGKTADRYGVKAIPLMFVLDRDGRISAIHNGYSEAALPAILEQVHALLPAPANNQSGTGRSD